MEFTASNGAQYEGCQRLRKEHDVDETWNRVSLSSGHSTIRSSYSRISLLSDPVVEEIVTQSGRAQRASEAVWALGALLISTAHVCVELCNYISTIDINYLI